MLALLPAALAIGAGAAAFRAVSGTFYGPGFTDAVTNSGRLAGDLVARYEREAMEILAALPSPLTDEAAVRLAASGAVDFVAREAGGRTIVATTDPEPDAGPAPADPRLGTPGDETWARLASGAFPAPLEGRTLRFFRPAGEGGGAAVAIGWHLPAETAAVLGAARDDFGRIRKLELRWRTWELAFLVAVPTLILGTVILAIVAARRTARRIARPVTELAVAADAIAAGDLTRRAPVAGEGEIRNLELSFNRMGSELEASREELLRVERVAAWRDVARRIAHEIKNPLTPIRLAIHRLEKRLPEDDEPARECLRSIDEEVASLGRIAGSFSEFAKMPPPAPAPTDFAAIARQVVELFRDASPSAAVELDVPKTLPVVADRDQLRRALTNLVKNAQEALADSGAGTVRVSLRRAGDRAVLEVADDGPGIPDSIRDTLFRPGVSAKPGGSGLGLAMVQRIAADHRGELRWTESGPGARFVLEIPLETNLESPESAR